MDNKTYIYILADTLTKKCTILDQLVDATLKQEKAFETTSPDIDTFEQLVTNKELLIEQLNQLDNGFERIYEHVKEEISSHRIEHKNIILKLQDLIKEVSEKSTKLQALEIKNKKKIEIYFSIQKKDIKSFKLSNQTATSYYKNMADQHQGQSYFLDKKK